MDKRSSKTSQLTISAVLLAMAAVLSMIKVYKLPLGGSITLLSMLPISIISIRYGVKWGMFCSFIYSVIQIFMGLHNLMTWGMTPELWIGCLVFDYIIAFSVLGLSGLFRKKGTVGICIGVGIALILRFISHFISGWIFFDIWCPEGWNTAFYSLCYNGSYMLPEIIFTIIGAVLIFKIPAMKKYILK